VAGRVLVVDDVAEMRALIGRVLSIEGYAVDVASNLAEARAMHPGRYAAVLIDAHLGAERGLDLVDELRTGHPAAVRRCLVITGGDAPAAPDGLSFLAKPFQPAELLAAVRALPGPEAGPAPGPPAGAAEAGAGWPAGAGWDGAGAPSGADDGGGRPAGAVVDRGWPPAGAREDGAGWPAEAGWNGAGATSGGGGEPLGQDQPGDGQPQLRRLLAIARRVRARERRELVDFLHDGPLQDLTASTLEAQLMRRSEPAGLAPRFDSVLRQLDAAGRALRWLVDGDLPFGRPEVELAGALRQRTAWLLASPLAVQADAGAAGLPPADVPAVADVAELLLLGLLPAGQPAQAQIAVRAEPPQIRLELTITRGAPDGLPVGDPAPAQAALQELAAALGVAIHTGFTAGRWQAEITLPGWL
jgi:CheY-like chemotaxis protein